VVVNFHTRYAINESFVIFGELDNAFNAHYGTYAIFGDPTGINAPGVPTNGTGVDPRFISPAPPIGLIAGIRVKF
jgi:outer membrane receptor protein involved in Fe transport